MKKGNEYATCQDCLQEMTPGNGCTFSQIIINGKTYKRIKSGDKNDFAFKMGKNIICHDCNAGVGKYHHFGCDCERCPACHGQLISCDCIEEASQISLMH